MTGELLTKITVWIALAGYASGVIIFLQSKSHDSIARIFWTAGCIAMIAHAVCAFSFHHHWSHIDAYNETARLTAEVFGLNWGGTIFINYTLIIGWIADVIWWWRGLAIYRNRSKIFSIVWHVFLFFIFFNATVVFEDGILRWLWLIFSLALVFILFQKFSKRSIGLNES
jgi:hypothetical protein